MRWLHAHWELKLIAMALAITLYLFIGGVTHLERAFQIEVRRSDLVIPPDVDRYVISAITPESFQIRLGGPRALLDTVRSETLRPRLELDAGQLASGSQSFPVTARLFGLPPELHIVGHEQHAIEVRVSEIIREDITLSITDVIFNEMDLPDGLVVDSVALTGVSRVPLVGTRDAIERIRTRQRPVLEPLSLAGLVSPDLISPVEKQLPLRLALGEGVRMDGEYDLGVTLRIAPRQVSRQLHAEVMVLAPADYLERFQVTVSPARRAFTVTGPKNRIDAENLAERIALFVDLSSRPSLDEGAPYEVRYTAPAWATIQVGAVQVTITSRGDE